MTTAYVWVHPARCWGEPCLGGHRLPTAMVVDTYLVHGQFEAEAYDITREDILVCCWFEARHGRSRKRRAALRDWLGQWDGALWTDDWSTVPLPPR